MAPSIYDWTKYNTGYYLNGALCGGICCSVTHGGMCPVDVVKTRIQLDPVWKSADGKEGSFRNDEQKEFARIGKPDFDAKDLVAVIENIKPTSIIGAVGRDPGCFSKAVVESMMKNNSTRPSIFALSNPKTQAEITSTDCWNWSNGKAIYGSGTGMDSLEIGGKMFCPGQVNNVYIFPGVSMGAVCCQASTIPERLFMVAAEAVANSLDAEDLSTDRVVPHPNKIRTVGLNVAAAVVFEAQKLGIARKNLGNTVEEVKANVKAMMWTPEVDMPVSMEQPAPAQPPKDSKSTEKVEPNAQDDDTAMGA